MVLLRNSIALVTMKGIVCSLSERQGSKEVPMRNVFLSCGTWEPWFQCLFTAATSLQIAAMFGSQLVHSLQASVITILIAGVLCIDSRRGCTPCVAGSGEL